MKINWRLFCAAAFFGGWLLVSNGAPLLPVALGVMAAAALNLWNQRRARAHE